METLVISSSSLSTFLYCRKAYQLGYERLLDTGSNAAMEKGTFFHKCMEAQAKHEPWPEPTSDQDSGMQLVAEKYLANNTFPKHIIMAEEPVYIEVIPGVIMRCTFDLLYEQAGVYVIRDYKTFGKMPSQSTDGLDLDFQARLYIAVARRMLGTDDVYFEWENVRAETGRFLGREPNKVWTEWTPDESYLRLTTYGIAHELDALWAETQDAVRDLVRAREEQRFYRVPRRGSMPYTCGTCLYKNLCSSELALGSLDEQTISLLSTPRKPLVIPEGATIIR